MEIEKLTEKCLSESLLKTVFPDDVINQTIESGYDIAHARYIIALSIVLPVQETLETLEKKRIISLTANGELVKQCREIQGYISDKNKRGKFTYRWYTIKLTSRTHGYYQSDDDTPERCTRQELFGRVQFWIKPVEEEIKRASSIETFEPSTLDTLRAGNIVFWKQRYQGSFSINRDALEDTKNFNESIVDLLKSIRKQVSKKIVENKKSLNHLPISYGEIKQVIESMRGNTIVIVPTKRARKVA